MQENVRGRPKKKGGYKLFPWVAPMTQDGVEDPWHPGGLVYFCGSALLRLPNNKSSISEAVPTSPNAFSDDVDAGLSSNETK